MNALIGFNLYYYYKTNRYLIPFALHLIFLYFIYGSGSLPLQEGYSLSTISIFICSYLIGFVIVDLEPSVIQKLFVLHYKNKLKRFYLSKILTLALLSLILIFIDIVSPLFLFGDFHIKLMFMTLIFQLSTALTGGIVAMFLSKKLLPDRVLAYILGFVILVLSLSVPGIRNLIPHQINFILYLLPPLHVSMNSLSKFDMSGMIYSLIYTTTVLLIWVYLISKRQF